VVPPRPHTLPSPRPGVARLRRGVLLRRPTWTLEEGEQGKDGGDKAPAVLGGEGRRPALGRAPAAGRCGGRERCQRRREVGRQREKRSRGAGVRG
jgi:hypothetical protein